MDLLHIFQEILTFRPEDTTHIDNRPTLYFYCDGEHTDDAVTTKVYSAEPFKMHLVASDQPDGDLNCIFDQSNVSDSDFDLEAAISGSSPDYKFADLDVASNGLISLIFLNQHYHESQVDPATGVVDHPVFEVVNVSDICEHFAAIFTCDDQRRCYYVVQEYLSATKTYLTSVMELIYGRKIRIFVSDGETSEDEDYPVWYVSDYQQNGTSAPTASPNV